MININAIVSTISDINNNANKLIINELKNNNLEGLAPSHGSILVLLYQYEEGIQMNQITAKINKDKSTVTALVNKLVKMNFIEKIKNTQDNRSTIIKLTKKGKETKTIVMDIISKKLLDTIYKDFNQEEKEQVCKLLKKIEKNFK